jgi:purine nucleosidase
MMSARPVIIDCDPGQDDAIALLLALAAPDSLDILGLTTVAGNVGVELTQRNARMVCEFAGRPDILVHAGCSRPMVREPIKADYYHGESGIAGFQVFEPKLPLQPGHAVEFLIRRLMSAPDGAVTLACLGPLTNIAMALVLEPRIARKLDKIVLMGGAQKAGGNITPTASFNIYCDPHAAHVVLSGGVPVVMVGLDLTHQIVMTRARLAAIAAVGNRSADAIHAMLTWDEERRLKAYAAGADGLPVSDVSVIAYLIDPGLFSGGRFNVRIETQSAMTMGMTVVDLWNVTGEAPNALWLQSVDVEGFFRLLMDHLRRG